MGREVRGIPEAAALADTASIGAWLRSQRLMRGIGLGELAAVTRIPRRSLERLEAGEFDANPDGFARGFVRAVSTALGLDPDDAVSRMLTEPETEAGESLGLPLRRVALILGLTGALLAVAWLWTAQRAEPGDAAPLEVPALIRRDAVRELAEDVRRKREAAQVAPPQPARSPGEAERAESTGSPRAD